MNAKPFIRNRIVRLLTIAWIVPATMACGSCEGDYESSAKFKANANHLTLETQSADSSLKTGAHELSDENGARTAVLDLVQHTPRMEAVYNELANDACTVHFHAATVFEAADDGSAPLVATLPMRCQSNDAIALRVELNTSVPMQVSRASIVLEATR